MTVIHRYPPYPEYRTSCCFRVPREIEGGEFTNDPAQVTCDMVARAAGDLPPLREPIHLPLLDECYRPPKPVRAFVPLSVGEASRLRTLAAAAFVAGVPGEDGDDVILEKLREVV